MRSISIKSIPEFDAIVRGLANPTIFRGVARAEYDLLPTVGRFKDKDRIAEVERSLIRTFKRDARPYVDQMPQNEWEWLALAQHHGVPTRLLDWTRNPLVGLYFGVDKHESEAGAVYAYYDANVINTDAQPEPYAVQDVGKYDPPRMTQRVLAQSAVFTVHPSPIIAFEAEAVTKIVVPRASKGEIRANLARFGVTRAALFPGLDGLGEYLRWVSGYEKETARSG